MVIYSEILGKQFKTVDECLAAEAEYNKKLKEAELLRKQEQEQAEKLVKEGYETLVKAWSLYLKALEKANYEIDGMEDMALLFVEVVLDAESRETKSPKS